MISPREEALLVERLRDEDEAFRELQERLDREQEMGSCQRERELELTAEAKEWQA